MVEPSHGTASSSGLRAQGVSTPTARCDHVPGWACQSSRSVPETRVSDGCRRVRPAQRRQPQRCCLGSCSARCHCLPPHGLRACPPDTALQCCAVPALVLQLHCCQQQPPLPGLPSASPQEHAPVQACPARQCWPPLVWALDRPGALRADCRRRRQRGRHCKDEQANPWRRAGSEHKLGRGRCGAGMRGTAFRLSALGIGCGGRLVRLGCWVLSDVGQQGDWQHEVAVQEGRHGQRLEGLQGHRQGRWSGAGRRQRCLRGGSQAARGAQDGSKGAQLERGRSTQACGGGQPGRVAPASSPPRPVLCIPARQPGCPATQRGACDVGAGQRGEVVVQLVEVGGEQQCGLARGAKRGWAGQHGVAGGAGPSYRMLRGGRAGLAPQRQQQQFN